MFDKEALNKNIKLLYDDNLIKSVSELIYTGCPSVNTYGLQFTNTDNKPFYISSLTINNNGIVKSIIYIKDIHISIEINNFWRYSKYEFGYTLELEIKCKYNKTEIKEYQKKLHKIYEDLWNFVENIYDKIQKITEYMEA